MKPLKVEVWDRGGGDGSWRTMVNLDAVMWVSDDRDRELQPAICLNFPGGAMLPVKAPLNELAQIFELEGEF